VVDDVAYFGLAPKQRAGIERNWAKAELAAFDLRRNTLLWRRCSLLLLLLGSKYEFECEYA